MVKKKIIGVFLGRIAPLHKGHQKVIDSMIKDFGIENSLVLIGSSNTFSERTPYTFLERKKMVKVLYPQLKVIGFPDVNPEKDLFEEKTLKTWIKNLKKLENKMNTKFVFYGGSKKDIGYLKKDFEVKIPVDRTFSQDIISATKIRKLLKENDRELLKKYLDLRIVPMAVSGWKKFKDSQKFNTLKK